MKKACSCFIFILLISQSGMRPAFSELLSSSAAKNAPVLEDIETLKAVNALKLTKEQLKQLVDIVREAVQKREKTLGEIRVQLVLGKTMDEIPELQDKLNNDNDDSLDKIFAILDDSQKRTAELMFMPLPQKEWNEILQLLPKVGQFLSDKRAVDIKLGNKMFSDETLNAFVIPLGKAFTELVNWVDEHSKEDTARKLFTQKTLELLKERLNAMK